MQRGSAGFTLLEMLMVLAILGVLAAFAFPSFGYLSANTKVKSASTEIYLAMIRARSESVKRNRTVGVIATSGNKDKWESGWSLVADGNNDGDFTDAEPTDRVISTQNAMSAVSIKMAATTVVFRPNGRISGAAPQFDVKPTDAKQVTVQRCVSTDVTGRPFIKTKAC